MRDSFSPRHHHTTGGVSISSPHRQSHQQNRPPFSPTNPKNVTNRTSSMEGDHHHHNHNSSSSNDPWKMINKFPPSSASSRLQPPNPEGRTTANHTLPRVASSPNHAMHRTFSRGRLMEGPAGPTNTATTATNISTKTDIWEGIHDDPTAWTVTTSSNMMMNDDSTWFGGGADIVVNDTTTTQNNLHKTATQSKSHRTSTVGVSSPFNWGRRTRSNNDVGNSYSSGSISNNNNNNNNIAFDFPSTDQWRLSKGASADSGERSLYDDSGEKIIRTTTTTNRKLISPKTSLVPLGSPSRPIYTTTTGTSTSTNNTEYPPPAADGSLTRPIAIHDCADVLDEREQDVLQNAARKQKGNSMLLANTRTKNSSSMAVNNSSMPPLRNTATSTIVVDDDARDSDILQKATKRRQGLLEKKKQQQSNGNENNTSTAIQLNKPIQMDMDLTKIEKVSEVDDATKQIPTPKQNKGIMGFFRGGGLGGGKRVETKKKSKGPGNQLDSPMSRSSRVSDTRKDSANATSTFTLKRPSPLNVWSPSVERSKISNRSKSPANLWTALSDETETDHIWNNTETGNSNVTADHKPITLQATTTTLSSDKAMKPDPLYETESLLEQPGHAGSNDTIDDGTTVSGVTNPSFFPEETPIQKITYSRSSTLQLSASSKKSFNVNSPVFTSGLESGRIAPSPSNKKIATTLPALDDDDFSDPFFPNGTEDVTKEESGISEAPDPDIDHVVIGTDNESDGNIRVAVGSKTERHKRSIVRKAVVARSNEMKAKKQMLVAPPIVPAIQPAQAANTNTTGVVDVNQTTNTRDYKSPVVRRLDRKNPATTVAGSTAGTVTSPPLVSMNVVDEVKKPLLPMQSSKRASPYRRGQMRHRDSTTNRDTKKELLTEAPKVIQTSSHIPPIVGRRAKINAVQENSIAVLAKSSSESTIAADPTAVVKSFSSNEDFGLNNGKRLGRSGDLSISSVASDIQRLRSILRRSRIQGNGENVRYIEPLESAFATYDEKQIKDPMQRAGLRLLSAAVVPIQSAVRRHLAFRSALTRMWAIVTIQAATRRWLIRYDDFRWATIKLQALHRGSRVREQLLLEHCCAIEIQRHVRGLIASWYVYDEIYKIKLVQACVRRKLAMEHAMDRMVSIIQIQSISRGFLLRVRQKRLIAAIIRVQAAWRCFTCRFSYQLDILDIIIVQSVWRKKIAQLKFSCLQHEHQVICATKIQSQWRSYDCSMNYLHYIADVLITQSVVRRYLAIQRCKQIRNSNALAIQMAVRSFLARLVVKRIRSAILIQSAYRGFVCYADYMFTISDIVLAQSVARRWLKQKDYPQKLHDYKSQAAVTIQKHWRAFMQRSEYFVMRQENLSAIAIQSAWRRFFHYTIFIVVIDSAIRIQSSCRGFLVREIVKRQNSAALNIQCAYRVLKAKKQLSQAFAAQKLFMSSKHIAIQQRQAVTDIQRVIRGAQVRDAVGLYTRTRIFQSAWRGYRARKLYRQHVSARRIQSIWRRHVAVVDFDVYRKARTIQSSWRRYIARSTFALYVNVRAIQSIWRGYAARSSYNIYRSARSVQRIWRGYEKRSSYNIYRKSRLIQAVWRGHAARTSYVIFVQARVIQLAWRSYMAKSTLHKHRAAKRIHAIWRGYVVRSTVSLYIQARSIQAAWRGYLVRLPYKEYIACRCIQSSWRRRMAGKALTQHIQARRLQTWWRCISQRVVFESHKANMAATRIQAWWRCKSVSSAFQSFLAARRIQTAWRGTSISRAYKHFMNVRLVQALWRGRVVRKAYRQHNGARKLQAVWRGRTIHIAYKHYVAARRIQTMWRGRCIRKAYMKYKGACRIQSVWRGRLINRAYKEFLMARRIQTFWRCKTLCMAHSKYMSDRHLRYVSFYSVCRIQALWRRKSLETAFKQYLAVVRIQTCWRAATVFKAYEFYRIDQLNRRIQFEAARKIQSNWRSKTLSSTYKEFKSSRRARYLHNSSALRIQTSWRAVSLQKAFLQYIACRIIQANWRRKLIRLAYLQFLACRRIQASWRGMLVRTAFKQFIATRQMQDSYYRKLFTNKSNQVTVVRKSHVNQLKSTKYVAATKIAAAWRSFSTCQRYWHVLGSVIEIQTIVRGWIARRQLKQLQDNALVQLRTINAIKYKSIARSRNYRDRNDKKRTDRAARTIQRFFLMVKAEVDREIRAEKKRRKVKKKSKKNRTSFDDKLLESVWRKTIEDDVKYLEYKRSMKSSLAPAQNVEKHNIPKISTKGSEDSRFSGGREVVSLCGTAAGTPMSASGRLGVVPLSVTSFRFDAEVSSKGASTRSPKSRLTSMSPREIDEDFLLEEAWIDSKIKSAKERRGGHRIIDPYQSTRSTKSRSVCVSEYNLPPTMPMQSRRPTNDGSSDRRPPRRTQAV